MDNKQDGITKGQKKLVITINESEFNNFVKHKIREGKSGQLLCYMALEKAGLFLSPSQIKKNKDKTRAVSSYVSMFDS